jgi:hypothetical protein
MRYFIGRTSGVWLAPTGGQSTYRSLAVQQEFWNAHINGTMPQAVARPGTSRHGYGRAIDLKTEAMQRAVRIRGAEFGWGIAGSLGGLPSDAPSEPWHAVMEQTRLTRKARIEYWRWVAARKRKGKR